MSLQLYACIAVDLALILQVWRQRESKDDFEIQQVKDWLKKYYFTKF